MIEYTNISRDDYYKLSDKEKKAKPYCTIYNYGDKCWFVNAKLHHEDAPAIKYAEGTEFWYINGELHRENGPAIIWSNGDNEWYLYNKAISFDDWCKKLNKKDEEIIFLRLKYGN